MVNSKHVIARFVVGLGLTLFISTGAQAQFIVFDVVRTAQFAVQGIQRLLSIVTEYEKVYTKEQEVEMWEGKNSVSEKDLPQAKMYEFLSQSKPMEMGSQKYLPSTNNAAVAINNIKKKLFFDTDLSQVTEAKKNEILIRRHEYLEALSKEVLSLSAGIREQIAEEQKALAQAKTAGGGNLHQMDLLVHTKKVMAEQKAADVILQAKLFELEAARLLMSLDPQLAAEPPKPQNTTENASAQGGNS